MFALGGFCLQLHIGVFGMVLLGVSKGNMNCAGGFRRGFACDSFLGFSEGFSLEFQWDSTHSALGFRKGSAWVPQKSFACNYILQRFMQACMHSSQYLCLEFPVREVLILLRAFECLGGFCL